MLNVASRGIKMQTDGGCWGCEAACTRYAEVRALACRLAAAELKEKGDKP